MACPDGQYFCNDRQKCMPIPKGHKVRKDGELVKEARTVRSKEDAEKMRQQKDNPDDWAVRNKGGGHWHPIHKDRLKGQRETRAKNLKPIKQKELEDHGKRNLHKDWKERAKKAIKIERSRKRAQEAERKQKQTETGKKHDVDHIQGQANRKKHSDRWHKVHPGDASDNRRVISQADNLKKNSKDSSEKKTTRASVIKRALDRARQNEEFVYEVAPPGWGHTKAEKEKTDPSKPKSKIGGTAAAFKRALDRGDFKGLPGSKTKKEKTSDMFKLMWAMKNKGDKPHYKPGTDEKYKKYQEEEYKDPVYYALQTDKKIMKLLDKDNKKKKKKYEESASMKNVHPKDRKVIRARQKNLFKKDLTGEHQGINELNTKEYDKLNKASVGMMSSDPKEQDKARARQTEVDYKDLLSQIKKKKVKVGKSMKEGKCDDCTCPGCGPNGVGHQNPCVKCGGHHKEEKVNEKYGDTFDTSKQKKKDAAKEKENTSRDLRMKYGKKWREFSKDALSAKNRLRPGEVKKLVNGKWVSNKS